MFASRVYTASTLIHLIQSSFVRSATTFMSSRNGDMKWHRHAATPNAITTSEPHSLELQRDRSPLRQKLQTVAHAALRYIQGGGI